jgi:hypothetical protein
LGTPIRERGQRRRDGWRTWYQRHAAHLIDRATNFSGIIASPLIPRSTSITSFSQPEIWHSSVLVERQSCATFRQTINILDLCDDLSSQLSNKKRDDDSRVYGASYGASPKYRVRTQGRPFPILISTCQVPQSSSWSYLEWRVDRQ